MGLLKIFIYSLLSGLSFTFSYNVSGGTGLAFTIFNQLSQNVDEQIQAVLLILSIILTIFFIYNLSKFFRQIFEHRIIGLATAVFGFTGSFLIFSSLQQSSFLIIGAVLWIAGIVLIVLASRS